MRAYRILLSLSLAATSAACGGTQASSSHDDAGTTGVDGSTNLPADAGVLPDAPSDASTSYTSDAADAAGQSDPTSWTPAGDNPKSYDYTIDTSTLFDGHPTAHITSHGAREIGFSTLLAYKSATPYLGKRVRLTAFVKSKDVVSWAGVWMRVDGYVPDGGGTPPMLGFDNMMDRPIVGTTDFTRYSVVLDVSTEAQYIYYGVLLNSGGEVWIGEAFLEIVDTSVPTTG